MSFRITGLPAEPFAPLFSLSDAELAAHGAVRRIADAREPGYPCRISLTDSEPGDELLLVNYEHHPVDSPYRMRFAIFVRKGEERYDRIDDVPEQLRLRTLAALGGRFNGAIVGERRPAGPEQIISSGPDRGRALLGNIAEALGGRANRERAEIEANVELVETLKRAAPADDGLPTAMVLPAGGCPDEVAGSIASAGARSRPPRGTASARRPTPISTCWSAPPASASPTTLPPAWRIIFERSDPDRPLITADVWRRWRYPHAHRDRRRD